jgi:hypothetical protein
VLCDRDLEKALLELSSLFEQFVGELRPRREAILHEGGAAHDADDDDNDNDGDGASDDGVDDQVPSLGLLSAQMGALPSPVH